MDTEGQPVRFRDCECPGTPHPDGDIAYLRPRLGFTAGAMALRMMMEGIDDDGNANRIGELVGPVYIREGVTSWNVVDEDGNPAPLDIEAILDDYSWALPIADAADTLYSGVVLAPLLKRMNGQSGPTSTGKPTSQTRRSSTKARSPRKSSSQNGSAGQPSPVNP